MRMLVALDVNDRAEQVLEAALPWALARDATCDLIFVEELGHAAALIMDPLVRDLVALDWNKVRDAQRARMDKLLAVIPEALRGEVVVETGDPARCIAEISASYGAIVIGTHARKGLGHLLMGSVAEKVVRSAACAVIVVRLDL